MSRGLDASTKTALDGDHGTALLIQLGFPTSVYLTDFGRDVAYDSNDYLSTGHFKSIDGISETGEIRVNEISLDLDGAEQTYVSLVLNNDYLGAQCDVLRAVINSSGAIVGTPYTYFSGRIVGAQVVDSGSSSTVSIDMASHWKDFEKTNGRRTNNGSQQRVFPSDLGMEFSVDQNRELPWGRR